MSLEGSAHVHTRKSVLCVTYFQVSDDIHIHASTHACLTLTFRTHTHAITTTIAQIAHSRVDICSDELNPSRPLVSTRYNAHLLIH